MGGVKDKYLKLKSYGDKYVGRCASVLDQLFDASSPNFYFSSIEDEVKNLGKRKDQILYGC